MAQRGTQNCGTPTDIARFFHDRSGCTVLREDRYKTILRCTGGAEASRPLFIKIYRYAGPAQAVRETLSRPRAERDLRTGLRLAAAHVPVPEPLGTATDRNAWGLVRQSLLVTRWMEDMVSLRDLVIPLFENADGQGPVVSALAASLGRFVADLHRCRVQCRDLNSGNFLVRQEAGGPFRIVLVDHESVRFPRRITAEHRTADLAHVAAFLLPLGQETPGVLCAAYADADSTAPGGLAPVVQQQAAAILIRREQDLNARFMRIGRARRTGGA